MNLSIIFRQHVLHRNAAAAFFVKCLVCRLSLLYNEAQPVYFGANPKPGLNVVL